MLAESYFETLESYLAEPHERHLLRAQELGRGLVLMNFPPEEVGAMHEQALERLEPVFGGYTLSIALHRTSAVLLEVLMAYGLAFRKQIAELTRRERALRESEERFRSITRNVPGAIFRQELRANGVMRFPFVSHRYWELFGHSGEELMADASALRAHLYAKDYDRLAHATRRSADRLEPLDIEVRVQAPDGKKRWMATISQPRRRDNGDIVWDGLYLDVTDQRRAKQRILHLANHDSLTDLPNRSLLNERLQRAIARGVRYARPFAVMWIDSTVSNRSTTVSDTGPETPFSRGWPNGCRRASVPRTR